MFRFACSVMLWGGGALQTNVTGLCGEHSRFSGHTGFAPAWGGGVCFPLYSAQAPGCSLGSGPCVACTSQAYATQIQVFRYSTKAQTRLGLRFVPSPVGAAQAARSLTSALSLGAGRLLPSAVPASVSMCAGRVHLVSVLGSWTLAATLPADVDHPESQKVFG